MSTSFLLPRKFRVLRQSESLASSPVCVRVIVLRMSVGMEKIDDSMNKGGPIKATVSAWQKIQIFFNVLNHVFISCVAIYMSFVCYGYGSTKISWHAWLCCIGYQLLMTEAIMALYPLNVWSQYKSTKVKRRFHWILQGVGSTMAIAGMIILYSNRNHHLRSPHSWVGFIAGIITFIGMLNGTSALWSVELRNYVSPIYSKCLHNLTGTTAFVLGMVALYLGYDRRFMIKNSRNDIRMWLQVMAVITIILSLIGAFKALRNHVRNILRI